MAQDETSSMKLSNFNPNVSQQMAEIEFTTHRLAAQQATAKQTSPYCCEEKKKTVVIILPGNTENLFYKMFY